MKLKTKIFLIYPQKIFFIFIMLVIISSNVSELKEALAKDFDMDTKMKIINLNSDLIVAEENNNLKKLKYVYTELVKIYANVKGEDHTDTLPFKHSLALSLFRLKEYDEAFTIMLPVFESYNKKFGENNKDTINALRTLLEITNELKNGGDLFKKYSNLFNKAINNPQNIELKKTYEASKEKNKQKFKKREQAMLDKRNKIIQKYKLTENVDGILLTSSTKKLEKAAQVAYENYFFKRAYLIYAKLAEIYSKKSGTHSLPAFKARRRMAQSLSGDGAYKKSAELLQKLATEATKHLSAKHQEVFQIKFALASSLSLLKENHKALVLINTFFADQEKLLGLKNEETLQTAHLKIVLELRVNGAAKANHYLSKAYKIAVKNLHKSHPLRLQFEALKGLVLIREELEKTGVNAKSSYPRTGDPIEDVGEMLKYAKARRLERKSSNPMTETDGDILISAAYDKAEKSMGVFHLTTLELLELVALKCRLDNNSSASVELQYDVTVFLKEILTEKHPRVLRSEFLVALYMFKTGKVLTAQKILEPVLEDQENILGRAAKETLETKLTLAETYIQTGNYNKARSVLVNIYSAIRENYGEEDDIFTKLLYVYTNFYKYKDEHKMLLYVYEKLLKINEKKFGKDSIKTKEIIFAIEKVNIKIKSNNALSEEQLLHLFNKSEKLFGKKNINTLDMRMEYALKLLENEKFSETITHFENCYDDYGYIYGSKNPKTLNSHLAIMEAYYKLGDIKVLETTVSEILLNLENDIGEKSEIFSTAMFMFAQLQIYKGNYSQALEYFHKSYEHFRKNKGHLHHKTLSILYALADTYIKLGNYEAADRIISQNFSKNIEKITINNIYIMRIAYIYFEICMSLGKQDISAALLKNITQANTEMAEIDSQEKLWILMQVLKKAGEAEKAFTLTAQYLDKALRTWGKYHPKFNEFLGYTYGLHYKSILKDIGMQNAQSTAITPLVNSFLYGKLDSLSTLHHLANAVTILDYAGHLEFAAFLGKIGVLSARQQRSRNEGLPRELQQTYFEKTQGIYLQTIKILIKLKRTTEAFYILNLLKEAELDDKMRSKFFQTKINEDYFSPTERIIYNQIINHANLVYLERQSNFLEERGARFSLPTYSNPESLDIALNMAAHILFSVEGHLKKQKKSDFALVAKKNMLDLQSFIPAKTQANFIHILNGVDEIYIFHTTPTKQDIYTVAIKNTELHALVTEFRTKLTSLNADPRPIAKKLYDILLKPLEKNLQQYKPQVLLFSLDGILRYVPVSALYDGKHWLIEKYAISMFTEATREGLMKPLQKNKNIVALGVTKALSGFTALPGVQREIDGIVKNANGGVMSGQKYLDEQFTQNIFFRSLQQKTPVIHIATHFQFDSFHQNNSFLLLGNGNKLTLENMFSSKDNILFNNIDLLTLSACDTALGLKKGDGREIESFGALAQKQGASAVLATFWPVADASTASFMQEFYLMYGSDLLGKAEALAKTQRLFIKKQLTAQSVHKNRKSRGKVLTTQFDDAQVQLNTNGSWAHPFYWAPFTLMGNWN